MRIYIAGPMTGLPQFNVPLFDSVAATLRERGHHVVSPAELDSPVMRAAALQSKDGSMAAIAHLGESWGDMLARDVKVIEQQVDAICVLPGWHRSRGARLEAFVGLLTGKSFYAFDPDHLVLASRSRDWVQQFIRENMP